MTIISAKFREGTSYLGASFVLPPKIKQRYETATDTPQCYHLVNRIKDDCINNLKGDAVFDKQANLDVHLIQVGFQLLVQSNICNHLLTKLLHFYSKHEITTTATTTATR